MSVLQAVEAIFKITPYRDTNEFNITGRIEVKFNSYTKHQHALNLFGTDFFELHLPIKDEERQNIGTFSNNSLTMRSFGIKYLQNRDTEDTTIEEISFEGFLGAIDSWFYDPLEAFVVDFSAFYNWTSSKTTIFGVDQLQDMIGRQRKRGPIRHSRIYTNGKAPRPTVPYDRSEEARKPSPSSLVDLSIESEDEQEELPPFNPENSEDEEYNGLCHIF